MVKAGAVHNALPGTTFVESKGQGATDGWTVVAEFDDALLPSGGNRELMFVVNGMVGRTRYTGAQNALVEVGLQHKNAHGVVFPQTVTRFWLRDNNLLRVTKDLRGLPFFWIRPYTVTINGKYLATAGTTLQVVARVSLNGDPPSIEGNFYVGGVTFLAWDLTNLDQAPVATEPGYFHTSYAPSTPQQFNPKASGFRQFGTTGSIYHKEPSTSWLVFWMARYGPGPQYVKAPHVQLAIDRGLGYGPFAHQSLGGMLPRGIQNTARTEILYQHGGAASLGVANNATVLALRGVDGHDVGTQLSTLFGFEVFGVRMDKFPKFSLLTKPDTDTGREKLWNDANKTPPTFMPLEPLLGDHPDLVICGNTTFIPTDDRRRSWAPLISSNERHLLQPAMFTWGESQTIGESVSQCVIHHEKKALGPNAPQLRLWGINSPLETQLAQDYYGGDMMLAAWHMELDPDAFTKGRRPPKVPTVVVIPGRESPDLSSLTALPVTPEHASPFALDEGTRHRLETVMGYAITWPKLATARRIWELSWVVSSADRDTLVDFFRDQGVRAFKWTPTDPHPTQIAAKLLVGPDETDLGNGNHELSATVLELLYVGT